MKNATLLRAVAALSLVAPTAELQAARLIIDSAKSDRVTIAAHTAELAAALESVSGGDCESVRVQDGPGYIDAVEFWQGGLAGSRWTVRLVRA